MQLLLYNIQGDSGILEANKELHGELHSQLEEE